MHPFLQFPQLFFLAPLFVPVLLRLAAVIVFLYVAWHTYAHRAEIAHIKLPVVGKAAWTLWFAIAVELLIAGCLFFGYYTQIAAVVGAIASLKFAFLKSQIGDYDPLARGTSLLLLVICLSLICTGAGAFALDLPL